MTSTHVSYSLNINQEQITMNYELWMNYGACHKESLCIMLMLMAFTVQLFFIFQLLRCIYTVCLCLHIENLRVIECASLPACQPAFRCRGWAVSREHALMLMAAHGCGAPDSPPHPSLQWMIFPCFSQEVWLQAAGADCTSVDFFLELSQADTQ